jgi:septal ring factor EnvC (AmiA/AmiB activator)
MLHKLCLPLGLLFLALPATAQDVKNNPDLFLQCADYDNARRAIQAEMNAEKSEAEYMNDQKDRLEDQINDHERELKRLDEILKIMRSSDNVWDKREREYNRYTRAFDEYDDFMVGFRNARKNYQRKVDRSNSLLDNLNNQCFGTWSGSILGEYCGQGSSRMQAFCSRFDR